MHTGSTGVCTHTCTTVVVHFTCTWYSTLYDLYMYTCILYCIRVSESVALLTCLKNHQSSPTKRHSHSQGFLCQQHKTFAKLCRPGRSIKQHNLNLTSQPTTLHLVNLSAPTTAARNDGVLLNSPTPLNILHLHQPFTNKAKKTAATI